MSVDDYNPMHIGARMKSISRSSAASAVARNKWMTVVADSQLQRLEDRNKEVHECETRKRILTKRLDTMQAKYSRDTRKCRIDMRIAKERFDETGDELKTVTAELNTATANLKKAEADLEDVKNLAKIKKNEYQARYYHEFVKQRKLHDDKIEDMSQKLKEMELLLNGATRKKE